MQMIIPAILVLLMYKWFESRDKKNEIGPCQLEICPTFLHLKESDVA